MASVRLKNVSPYGALDVELLRAHLGRTVVEAGEEFDVPAEIAAELTVTDHNFVAVQVAKSSKEAQA